MTIRDDQFYKFDPEVDEMYVDGQRVTAELMERAAAAAETPAGSAGHPWLKPGGKSLSGDGKHSPRFQVVLGADVAEKVRAAAEREKMSVSKWIRRVLEQQVA